MDHMRWRMEQMLRVWVYMEEHHFFEMPHHERESHKPLFEMPPQNRLAEKPYLFHAETE